MVNYWTTKEHEKLFWQVNIYQMQTKKKEIKKTLRTDKWQM